MTFPGSPQAGRAVFTRLPVKALILLLNLPVTFIVAEGLFRLCPPEYLYIRREADRFSRNMVVTAPTFPLNRLRPSSPARLYGKTIRTNSAGYRGAEFTPPPTGEKLCVVMGRSIAFGWGVGQGEEWPALMEKKLRRAGRRVVVRNLSVPAWILPDALVVAFRKVPAWKPDILLFVVHATDLAFLSNLLASGGKPPAGALPPLLERAGQVLRSLEKVSFLRGTYLLTLLKGLKLRYELLAGHRTVEFSSTAAYRDRALSLLFLAMETLDRFCRRFGTTLVLFDMFPLKKLESFCAEKGIAYAPGKVDFSKEARKCLISSQDPHPNAFGQALLAGKAARALEKVLDRLENENRALKKRGDREKREP